jgi:hypothetical protein
MRGSPLALSLLAIGLLIVIIVHLAPDASSIRISLTSVAPGEVPSSGWHEFFSAMVTASTTMLAATVAVGAFAQRPRDLGEKPTVPVQAMTIAVIGTIVRLLLAPLVLFSASTMLSVLMLVPHFAVRHLETSCVAVSLLELAFLVVFEIDTADLRRTIARLKIWSAEADRLRFERRKLVEALQPYLPASEKQGRPRPSTLLDLTKGLELYGAHDELRVLIDAHNADRQERLEEALDAQKRHQADIPFIREAERFAPPLLRQGLTAFGVIMPLWLFYAATPPLFAFIVSGMTFLGITYVVLALLGLMRANVARLTDESLPPG